MCCWSGHGRSAVRDTSAIAVVQAYQDAFNAQDVERTKSYLAPDFVWLSIVGDSAAVDARGWSRTFVSSRARVRSWKACRPSARGFRRGSVPTGPRRLAHGRSPRSASTKHAAACYDGSGSFPSCARGAPCHRGLATVRPCTSTAGSRDALQRIHTPEEITVALAWARVSTIDFRVRRGPVTITAGR